jgi:hypothetical protein
MTSKNMLSEVALNHGLAAAGTDEFRDVPIPPHPRPPLARARDRSARGVLGLMHDGARNSEELLHVCFRIRKKRRIKWTTLRNGTWHIEEKKRHEIKTKTARKVHLQLRFSSAIFIILTRKKYCA